MSYNYDTIESAGNTEKFSDYMPYVLSEKRLNELKATAINNINKMNTMIKSIDQRMTELKAINFKNVLLIKRSNSTIEKNSYDYDINVIKIPDYMIDQITEHDLEYGLRLPKDSDQQRKVNPWGFTFWFENIFYKRIYLSDYDQQYVNGKCERTYKYADNKAMDKAVFDTIESEIIGKIKIDYVMIDTFRYWSKADQKRFYALTYEEKKTSGQTYKVRMEKELRSMCEKLNVQFPLYGKKLQVYLG